MELLAKFNKILLAPSGKVPQVEYDLNVVITSGMTGKKLEYKLEEKTKLFSIQGNILYVNNGAGGYSLTVNITDENKNSARASTKIISFTSIANEFSKNEDLLKKLDQTKNSWSTIIGDSRKEDAKKQ